MLGQKAIDCLHIAEARPGSDERKRRAAEASARWSEKAVERKMEELVGRGYMECGVNAWGGWLTVKGKAELEKARG